MVKDHSDSERGNPQLPHGLLFPINSKDVLHAPSYRQDSTYHGLCYTSCGALAGTRNTRIRITSKKIKFKAFVKPVVEHWLEREIPGFENKIKYSNIFHSLYLYRNFLMQSFPRSTTTTWKSSVGARPLGRFILLS